MHERLYFIRYCRADAGDVDGHLSEVKPVEFTTDAEASWGLSGVARSFVIQLREHDQTWRETYTLVEIRRYGAALYEFTCAPSNAYNQRFVLPGRLTPEEVRAHLSAEVESVPTPTFPQPSLPTDIVRVSPATFDAMAANGARVHAMASELAKANVVIANLEAKNNLLDNNMALLERKLEELDEANNAKGKQLGVALNRLQKIADTLAILEGDGLEDGDTIESIKKALAQRADFRTKLRHAEQREAALRKALDERGNDARDATQRAVWAAAYGARFSSACCNPANTSDCEYAHGKAAEWADAALAEYTRHQTHFGEEDK